jgi:hypothetical protein
MGRFPVLYMVASAYASAAYIWNSGVQSTA